MGETARKKEDENIEPEQRGTAEIIDLAQKRGEKQENELQGKIGQERMESREQFKSLIDEVSAQYESLPEAMKKDFIIHNGEILDNTIDLAMRKGLSKEEIKISELAAILHDKTKADSVPEKYKDISNYTLAMHGKTAAEKVPEILTDERLKELKVEGDPEMIRQEVAKAILEHMGPRPGFMTYILEKFNQDMKNIGEEGVDYPEADGKISGVLLAADMKSLAGEKGRNKVLSIRANVKPFIDADLKTVEEYKKYGIDLSQGEAALLSGFDSAFQARDMQKDEENRKWINKAIEDSQEVEYDFPPKSENGEKSEEINYNFPRETVTWQKASSKRRQYEEARKVEEARKKLQAA